MVPQLQAGPGSRESRSLERMTAGPKQDRWSTVLDRGEGWLAHQRKRPVKRGERERERERES